LAQQFGAQPPALPGLDDCNSDIRGLRVVGMADVAGDTHPAPGAVVQCAECLVIVVVHLCEAAQLRRRSPSLGRRNRIQRDAALSLAKAPASSLASLCALRITAADPSRSTTWVPVPARRCGGDPRRAGVAACRRYSRACRAVRAASASVSSVFCRSRPSAARMSGWVIGLLPSRGSFARLLPLVLTCGTSCRQARVAATGSRDSVPGPGTRCHWVSA
jgi:hypothetical protein